jgi:ornithine decarboxylase
VIAMLAELGSCFDTASRPEIESVLAAGVSPDRISFGNTIKKERDIAWAFEQGIELFAFDSDAELDKLARVAPGAKVFCRLLMTCEGAEWPLSRKFGCEAEMARDLLIRAKEMGLEPYGISFHVGSQQTRMDQWDIAIGKTAMLFSELNAAGIELKMINLGGGLPARYRDEVASVDEYSNAIMNAMTKHFGNDLPLMIVEPGRSLVGDSGILETEVVLISRKSYEEEARWVYLDIGKFGGLAETMDEAIKYRLQVPGDIEGAEKGVVILAGPTCDSADILYEKQQYRMPMSLKVGDKIRILSTGAYTTSYSAVNFNGFAPLKAYYI